MKNQLLNASNHSKYRPFKTKLFNGLNISKTHFVVCGLAIVVLCRVYAFIVNEIGTMTAAVSLHSPSTLSFLAISVRLQLYFKNEKAAQISFQIFVLVRLERSSSQSKFMLVEF